MRGLVILRGNELSTSAVGRRGDGTSLALHDDKWQSDSTIQVEIGKGRTDARLGRERSDVLARDARASGGDRADGPARAAARACPPDRGGDHAQWVARTRPDLVRSSAPLSRPAIPLLLH